MASELLCQSFEHLACLTAVLRQPCVSCGCLKSLRKRKQIAKKMNMSRLPQDGHAKFTKKIQDCRKTKRYVVRFPHCSRAVIVRFSVVVIRFAAFLQQPCDKAHGHLAIVLRLSKDKCVAGEVLLLSYEHLACLAAVLRQPCVSCGCHTSLRKRTQIA